MAAIQLPGQSDDLSGLEQPGHRTATLLPCQYGDNLPDDGHSTIWEDTPMRGLAVVVTLLIGGIVVRAGAEQPAPGCAKVAAAMDQAGGNLSADEIAKKTSTDVETVRGCMDAWRASHKDAAATAGSPGQKPVPPGCTKIVGVLDQQPGLSADEIAKRTSTDVETVRGCTDLWRQQKAGAAR
jgi:hypothetical protein